MITTKDPPIIEGPFRAVLDLDCTTYDPGVSFRVDRITRMTNPEHDEFPLGFDAVAMTACYRLLLIAYEELENPPSEKKWLPGWRVKGYYDLWIEPGGIASIESKFECAHCVLSCLVIWALSTASTTGSNRVRSSTASKSIIEKVRVREMQNTNTNPWTVAREFSENNIAVIVKRQVLTPRHPKEIPKPIFSYEIGRINDNKQFVRFFGVPTDFSNGRVSIRNPLDVQTLARLIAAAEEYVLGECQAHADAVIAAKQEREQNEINRGKPAQRPGLKELSKRDKAMRHREST